MIVKVSHLQEKLSQESRCRGNWLLKVDWIEIGVGLTAFGLFFMMMGVMMLFDGGLMAIGNVS